MNENNPLTAFSEALVRAVATAAAATVRVDGRKGLSASGVIFQPGWVISASHTVERKDNLQVELPDGSQVPARLAGRDPASDLCLLHIEGVAAYPAEPAPAEAQVGQMALALGRPTSEGIQASLGVVGAVGGPLYGQNGRLLERFIRTDAIPYPGFSGGPLIDGDGRVLGINTSGFVPGASLAVPAAVAWQVGQALSQHGRMRRGYLGVRSQAVDLSRANGGTGNGQAKGLLLVGVERGQPGERAGLMVGDILLAIDGRPLDEHERLIEHLAGNVAGQCVVLDVLRGGRQVQLDVQIGERPE